MKKKTKFRINALISTIVTVAAVILVNAVISTVAGKIPMKIDLTKDSVYEFSDYTKEVMKKLDKEVNVYALYPSNMNSNEYVIYAEEYLAKYEALNKNFKVTYIDPYTNPAFAKKYENQGEEISAGAIIIECKDRVKVLNLQQMYEANRYTGEAYIDMEKKITSAVMNVTSKDDASKIYFTEGHDEYPSVELKEALSENGYEHENINISLSKIPEDAKMLIVLAPTVDWSAEEIEILDKYLDEGGNAFFAFEGGMTPPSRLNSYLSEWGISFRGDFIIEEDPNRSVIMQGVPMPVPYFKEHDITNRLIERKMINMTPSAGSLEVNDKNIRYAKISPLMTTTENSWGKKDLSSGILEKTTSDYEGPLTVAALSEMTDSKGGCVFAVGSLSAIEYSGVLKEASYANGDFVLNAIGYMTKADSSLDIRAKLINKSALAMTEGQVILVTGLLQYALPFVIILAGLMMWLKRRYK